MCPRFSLDINIGQLAPPLLQAASGAQIGWSPVFSELRFRLSAVEKPYIPISGCMFQEVKPRRNNVRGRESLVAVAHDALRMMALCP